MSQLACVTLPLVAGLSGALFVLYRQNRKFLEEIDRCSIVPHGIKSNTSGLIRRDKQWLFRRNASEPWVIVRPTSLVEIKDTLPLTVSYGLNSVLTLPPGPERWNYGGWVIEGVYLPTGPESILTDFTIFEHVMHGKEPPGATGVGYSDLDGNFVPCGGGSRFVDWLVMAGHQSLDPAFALTAHLSKAVLEKSGVFAHIDLNQCESMRLVEGPWKPAFNATGFDLVAYKIPAPVWAKLGIRTLTVKHLCFDATANLIAFGNPEGMMVQSFGVCVENPDLERRRGIGSYTANTDSCFSGFPVFSKADATWKFHGVHSCGDAYKTGCNHFVNCYAVLWLLKRTGVAMKGALKSMLLSRCESKEGNRKMRAWLASMRQLENDEEYAVAADVALEMLYGDSVEYSDRAVGAYDDRDDDYDYYEQPYDPYESKRRKSPPPGGRPGPEGPRTAHVKVTQTRPPTRDQSPNVYDPPILQRTAQPDKFLRGRRQPNKVVFESVEEPNLPRLPRTRHSPERFIIYDDGERASSSDRVRSTSRSRIMTAQGLNVSHVTQPVRYYDISTGDDVNNCEKQCEGFAVTTPIIPGALTVRIPTTRAKYKTADQHALQSARNPEAMPYCRFVQSKITGVKTWKDAIAPEDMVHKYSSTEEIVSSCPPITPELDDRITTAFKRLRGVADFEQFQNFTFPELIKSTFVGQYVRDHLARTWKDCSVTMPAEKGDSISARTNPVCMPDKDGLPCFIRRATIGSGAKASADSASLDADYLDALRAIGEPMDNQIHGSDFIWPPSGPKGSDESLRHQSTEVGRHDLSQATTDPTIYEGMFQQTYTYKLLSESNLASAIEHHYDTADGTKSQGFTSFLKTGAKSAWLNTSENRQDLTYFVICRIALRTAIGSEKMFNMTPIELCNHLLNDPCVASTKAEAHSASKATRRAWRQIHIPSFIDSIILSLLSVDKNKQDIESWDQGLQHRSCVGLGHHDAGIQRIGKMLEWVSGSNGRVFDEDASAWDLTQSRDILLLTADARVYGLETDNIGIMSELIYQASACNTAVCLQIGRYVWESQRFGMTITGCCNTSEQNTWGRNFGAQLCGSVRVATLGDDLACDGITEKDRLISFGVRSKIEVGKEAGSPAEGPHDFTSHRFTRDSDGVWHAEFLNFRKLLANLRFRSSAEAAPSKEQLGGVKFAVRHNPGQLAKLEALSDMLGWNYAAAIAAPYEDLG